MREDHEWRKDRKVPGRSICRNCGLIRRMYYGDAEQEASPREYYFLGNDLWPRGRTEVEYIGNCAEVAMRMVLE